MPADDPTNLSFYGWTKLQMEKDILDSNIEKYLIIRISYPFRRKFAGKDDFARGLLKLYDAFASGSSPMLYPIFTDQQITPTFVDDLSPALAVLAESNSNGIFHIASPALTTPYEFFCGLLKVARGIKNPERIIPRGSIREFQLKHPTDPKRPIIGGLKTDKITRLGFTPTSWQDGVEIYTSILPSGQD